MNPVLEIKAITRRKNPIYQNAFVGHSYNLLLSGLIRISFIEDTIRIACPTVRAVNVPRAGGYRFICYVAFLLLSSSNAPDARRGSRPVWRQPPRWRIRYRPYRPSRIAAYP